MVNQPQELHRPTFHPISHLFEQNVDNLIQLYAIVCVSTHDFLSQYDLNQRSILRLEQIIEDIRNRLYHLFVEFLLYNQKYFSETVFLMPATDAHRKDV